MPFTRSYTITCVPINSPWDVTEQNKRLCCRCWGMEGESWRDGGDASVARESGVTSIQTPLPDCGSMPESNEKQTCLIDPLEYVPSFRLHKNNGTREPSYSHSSISLAQNGRLLSPFSPCVIAVTVATVSPSWMLSLSSPHLYYRSAHRTLLAPS